MLLFQARTMKTINTLAMDEEMVVSPSGVPHHSFEEAAINGSSPYPNKIPPKVDFLTNDSLEEALNEQLASLDEEEMETSEETKTADLERTETAGEQTDTATECEEDQRGSEKEGGTSDRRQTDEPMMASTSKDLNGSTADSNNEKTTAVVALNDGHIKTIVEQNGKPPRLEHGKTSMKVTAEGDQSSNGSSSTKENNGVTSMEVVAEKANPEIRKSILNFEEGLKDLMNISQRFKAIDEDPIETRDKPSSSTNGVKRALAETTKDHSQAAAKRSKQDEDLRKSLKKKLRHLPRKEMEDLVAEKIVEMLSSRSELGELRRQCDAYKEKDEKWKRKIHALLKMCQDLNTVMRRYITDVQKEKEEVVPIKITRSVGLQVTTDRWKPTPVVAAEQTPATVPITNTQPQQPQGASGVTVSRLQQVPAPIRQMTSPIPSALLPQTPIPINDLPAGTRPLPISKTNGSGAQRVIDVVDLDDDDGVTAPTTSAVRQNPILVPSSQVVIVPSNQVMTSKAIFVSNVNNSTTVTPTMTTTRSAVINRLVLTRPQQQQQQPEGGQALVTRNGTGPVMTRATRFVPIASRPVVVPACQINGQQRAAFAPLVRPAPLPVHLSQAPLAQKPFLKKEPPKPKLKITRHISGIVLSWNMDVSLSEYAPIAFYQIYAYQDSGLAANANTWKKVGDVEAMQLPMACTLTQFTKGNLYHFTVRAQDAYSRFGQFSDPQSISLA